MKPITVVTVVRNAGKLLEPTIESVNRQTVRDKVEYIVVDGGSTDGTAQAVEAAAELGRVDRWISEPDHGIYDAMSKALVMAQGEWILFMNAGDGFYTAGALEALWRETERHPGCSGVYGGCVVVYPDGRRKTEAPRPPRHIYTHMVCSHQSLLLRTEKAREYPFDLEFKIAADHHQLMRMVQAFEPLYAVKPIVAEVTLETYTWAQLKAGLKEKRRSLWKVTGNVFFYLYHWWRAGRVGLKHAVKNLLKRGILRE